MAALCCLSAFAQSGWDKTSTQIAKEMMSGWNLGNTMEAINWKGSSAPIDENYGLETETHWQDTKTTADVIRYVKTQGFRSVRIPCNWRCGHISDAQTQTIDEAWINRVKEIVDDCIDEGLYVILNDHYDGGWIEQHIADDDASAIATNKAVLKNLWTQIATAFKDYDEHLLCY